MTVLAGCEEPATLATWAGEVTVSPAEGATRVSPLTDVSVRFSSAPPDGTRIWIDGGADFTGGFEAENLWTASMNFPLDRDTTHHIVVDAAATRFTSSFHTVGEPLDADISCRTYEMDLQTEPNITWITPELGPAISFALDATHSVLLMVTARDETSVSLVGAAGTTVGGVVTQATFLPVWTFDPADFSNDPALAIPATDVYLEDGGETFTLFSLAAEGEFAVDGTSISDFHVTALLDARPIDTVDACALAECLPCPDQADAETAGCLPLEFVVAETPWVEGLIIADSGC